MEVNSAQTSEPVLNQKKVKSLRFLINLLASLFIVIFLISLLTFFSAYNSLSEKQFINSEKIKFEETGAKASFDELLKAGFESKNKEEKSKNLINAYLILWVDYFREPSVEKREVLSSLYNYLENNFPSEAKESNLSVPCRQELCGAVFTYTPELSEIKDSVQKIAIQDVVRKSILSNIESAALAHSIENNKQPLYSSYSAIFYSLRSAWGQDKNGETQKIMLKTLGVMEAIDMQRYEIEEKAGLYKID